MSSKEEKGFAATKPVSAWNKDINADFKEFFKGLTKFAIDGITGNWVGASTDIADIAASVGLENKPEEIAWLLVRRALKKAIIDLVKESVDTRQKVPDSINGLVSTLDLSLEQTLVTIDKTFFDRPACLEFVKEFEKPFCQWLEGIGFDRQSALSISTRLSSYFTFSLNDEWRARSREYSILKDVFETPFANAVERERNWIRYLSWLQRLPDEPLFDEPFGLREVYVPLKASSERKYQTEKEIENKFTGVIEKKLVTKTKHEEFNLEDELTAWFKKSDKDDPIRVIKGEPGCGKSTFAKLWAAELATTNNHVLYIPLHQFDPSDDLMSAIDKYVRLTGSFSHNPLDRESGDSSLLLIFDGLDELTMQGKVAQEVAQQFVHEIDRTVSILNASNLRVQVLICGRDLVVEHNKSEFRKSGQIIEILPYDNDRCDEWWVKYGKATGRLYKGLPPALSRKDLHDITSRPLLNYLLALSYERKKLDFEKESNLNAFYADLLEAIYERGWAESKHAVIREMEFPQFVRILQEIAISAWHQDSRKTTVSDIQEQCERNGLHNLLEIFQEGAKGGVIRLLTAFYFRHGDYSEGERTFEFTHKTFQEFLTASAILRMVEVINDEVARHRSDPGRGWDEKDALSHWITLCGPTAIDSDLFLYISRNVELASKENKDIIQWQMIFSRLLSVVLRNGMPMERLDHRHPFLEESRQARNAIEAILAIMSATARCTGVVSKVDWPTTNAFGQLLLQLKSQKLDPENSFVLGCLNQLDCSDQILSSLDLYGADLSGSILRNANLIGSNLEKSILRNADLTNAKLCNANLSGSILLGANVDGVDFSGAKFSGSISYEPNIFRPPYT